MAHDGKIACHFPVAGNPNHDVYGITFLPAGDNASNLLTIDKVYYLSASDVATMKAMSSDAERLAYLLSTNPTHRVWELQNKSLTAGSDFVAIEYVPPTDITVSSIAIFAASGSNIQQTAVSLIVMHESGIPVLTSVTSTFEHRTIYGLEGNKQICSSFNYFKMYGGQKYYIIFEGTNHDFYPAYFQNSAGNYKKYSNNQASSQTSECFKYWDLEPSSPPKYIGNLNTSEGIFGIAPGSWFMWLNGYGAGISRWRMYRRTNVGSQYTFQGIVGDSPDNQTNFEYRHAVQLIQKGPTGDFIWYCQSTPNVQLRSGAIYTKEQSGSTQYTAANTIAVAMLDTGNDRFTEIADIFKGLKQKAFVITAGGNYYHNSISGYMMSLKSGYTNMATDEPLTALPDSPQANEIYYLSDSISGISYTAMYLYTGSSWTAVNYDNYTTYLNAQTIDTVLTKVGEASEFLEEAKANGNTVDVDQIFQTFFLEQNTDTPVPMYTDRKYYLEINGQEV